MSKKQQVMDARSFWIGLKAVKQAIHDESYFEHDDWVVDIEDVDRELDHIIELVEMECDL